jgi:hypothetical protein
MSYVIAAPEMMTAAATDLAGIGSVLSEAHAAAVAPTVALVPAAADEVSAGVAHLFSCYAEDFHGLAGKAAAFHEHFVGQLNAGASSYASTEAAIASLLHPSAASAHSLGSTPASNLLATWVQQFGLWGYTEIRALWSSPFFNSLPKPVQVVIFLITFIPWAFFAGLGGVTLPAFPLPGPLPG